MPKAPIKVFQHGKGTRTLLDFSQGQKQHKLTREGSGHFLGNTFESEQAAVDFCQRELRNDPGVVLYVMEGDLILRMVLDQAVQEERKLQRARKNAIPLTLAFGAIFWVIITVSEPFRSTQANLALAGGLLVTYVLLLMLFGTRNLELGIMLTLFLILLCMFIPALRRARERSEKGKHSALAAQFGAEISSAGGPGRDRRITTKAIGETQLAP